MVRGSRRLLYDLDVFGRIVRERTSARDRLESQLGPLLVRKLLDGDDGRPSSTSTSVRRRRVA